MRRGTFRDETVDYAAVGATQAPDLMQYPPERSIPAEESWRIGSGEARFHTASDALLSWAAQRGAGLELKDVRPASGPMYSGVSFDAEGNAIAPSRTRRRSALRRRRHALRRRRHDDPARRPREGHAGRRASCA